MLHFLVGSYALRKSGSSPSLRHNWPKPIMVVHGPYQRFIQTWAQDMVMTNRRWEKVRQNFLIERIFLRGLKCVCSPFSLPEYCHDDVTSGATAATLYSWGKLLQRQSQHTKYGRKQKKQLDPYQQSGATNLKNSVAPYLDFLCEMIMFLSIQATWVHDFYC